MVTPDAPVPNSPQFGLNTLFLVVTGLAALFALAGPRLRELTAEEIRWYGLLAANFVLPAIGGVLFARLRMLQMARRAGRPRYSIYGKLNSLHRSAPLVAFVVLIAGVIPAFGLASLNSQGVVASNSPVVMKLVALMHFCIGYHSALGAMHMTWWWPGRRAAALELHDHGLFVNGVWFFAWKRVSGFRWSEASASELSIWLPWGRLKIATHGAHRDEIEAEFESHGVWGTTEPH